MPCIRIWMVGTVNGYIDSDNKVDSGASKWIENGFPKVLCANADAVIARTAPPLTWTDHDQSYNYVILIWVAKEFTWVQLCRRCCRLHIMTVSLHTAKWRRLHVPVCTWIVVLILANASRNSHSHARFHDFSTRSLVRPCFRPFLHAFTVSKLHILQHCLIKCMSCRLWNMERMSCPRYSPIKVCRAQGLLRRALNVRRLHCVCMLQCCTSICRSRKSGCTQTHWSARRCRRRHRRCSRWWQRLTLGTLFEWWELLLRHLRRVRRHV